MSPNTTKPQTNPAICDCNHESHKAYVMEAGIILQCGRCGSLTLVPYTDDEIKDIWDHEFLIHLALTICAVCVGFAVILIIYQWAR